MNGRIRVLFCAMSLTVAPAIANDVYGYVDTHGRVVVKPQYAGAGNFSHGFANVCPFTPQTQQIDCAHSFFIDTTGRHHGESVYSHESPPCPDDSLYQKYQLDGKAILQDRFYSIWSRRGPLLFVKRWYDFVVADEAGNVLKKLPNTWQIMGEDPKTGNQWCKVGDEAFEFTGHTNGKVPGFEPVAKMPMLFEKQYDYFDTFHEGLAAVMDKDGHWSYIDGDGKVKISLPHDCSNAQAFSEGLAVVSLGGRPWSPTHSHARISAYNGAKFGFIDKTGKFIIAVQFPCPDRQWSSTFKNGLAVATGHMDGDVAFGCIDRRGDFVVKPLYKSVSEFSDGLALVNAGEVGFDSRAWQGFRHGYQGIGEADRFNQFYKLLRQFDLIGMPRKQFDELLGQPDAATASELSYVLSSGCTGGTQCIFKFTDEHLTAYRLAGTGYFGQRTENWITRNVKPDFDVDTVKFGEQAATGELPVHK